MLTSVVCRHSHPATKGLISPVVCKAVQQWLGQFATQVAVSCNAGRSFRAIAAELRRSLFPAGSLNGRQVHWWNGACNRRGQVSHKPKVLSMALPSRAPVSYSSAATEPQTVEMQAARILCAGKIADELVEGLLSFGATSCTIEDANLNTSDEQEIYSKGPLPWQSGQRQLWEQSCVVAYFPADQDVGEALAMAADSVGLTTMPDYRVEKVEDNDNWVQQVQDMFRPMEVAEGLFIIPKWCIPPSGGTVNVILDPGLAFGTGEHPTTRLCLRWLYEVIQGGERVLDYGTGSGILAVAALKMGAKRAIGVDTDPVAVSSAIYNASLNNLPHNSIEVFVCDPDGNVAESSPDTQSSWKSIIEPGEMDIVVANILLNPLLALADQLAGYARPGGLVGLSGILESQVEQLKDAYSEFLDDIVVSVDTGWAQLSGRRKAKAWRRDSEVLTWD